MGFIVLSQIFGITYAQTSHASYRVVVATEEDNELTQDQIQQAFATILVRFSGTEAILEKPEIKIALKNARSYLARIINNQTIELEFSKPLVDDLFVKVQQSHWGNLRPTVLFWGVAQDERHLRFLDPDQDPDFFKKLFESAARYGVSLYVPLLDIYDTHHVSVHDIWGAFPSALWSASSRYEPDVLLLAKLDKQGTIDWEVLSRISPTIVLPTSEIGSFAQTKAALESLAQSLLQFYGVGSDKRQAHFELRVQGIRSGGDYAQIQQLIENLDSVKMASIKQIQPDRIVFDVSSNAASKDNFARILNLHKHFVQLAQNDINGTSTLNYEWVP